MKKDNANLTRRLSDTQQQLAADSSDAEKSTPANQHALAQICAERDGTLLSFCLSLQSTLLVILTAEARSQLVKQSSEMQSLRSQLEADRAKTRQDDAYKLKTMQYLRKYEAELQKKETQLDQYRTKLAQLQTAAS